MDVLGHAEVPTHVRSPTFWTLNKKINHYESRLHFPPAGLQLPMP
jgi:hypothetical protein